MCYPAQRGVRGTGAGVENADATDRNWIPSKGQAGFRFWEAPALPALSVIAAREHAHDYPFHLHDCTEIIWNHAGRVGVTCRGVTYELQAGDICVLAPNELHSTYVPSGSFCTSTLIHIPTPIFAATSQRLLSTGARFSREPFFVTRETALATSLPVFLDGIARTNDREEVENLASQLVAAILRAPTDIAASRLENAYWHPAVIRAREALSASINEEPAVADIAAEVGLNMRYFIALFKDGTGLSPHQFQIALRVDRARSLIQGRRTPLCEVAISSGFSDQSHLNRHFKRRYGFTPKAFQSSFTAI